MQNINVCGIPPIQLAPGEWAGNASNPPNQPYYVELSEETGFVTLAVDVVNFGSGSFTIQFDADSLQNYPGSAFFALPSSGLQPIPVSEGSATGWIYASLYLTIFGPTKAFAHMAVSRVRWSNTSWPSGRATRAATSTRIPRPASRTRTSASSGTG